MPESLEELQKRLARFAEDRDWGQFHTPKNLLMALAGEVGELVALFQWLTPEAAAAVMEDPVSAPRVREEMADAQLDFSGPPPPVKRRRSPRCLGAAWGRDVRFHPPYLANQPEADVAGLNGLVHRTEKVGGDRLQRYLFPESPGERINHGLGVVA